MKCNIKDFKVLSLPPRGEPNSRYYVPNDDGTILEYVTDHDGNYFRVASGDTVVASTTVTSANIANLQNNVSQLSERNSAFSVLLDNQSAAITSLASVLSAKNDIINIQDEGVDVASNPTNIDFRGAGVSVHYSASTVIVDITGGGGGGGSVTSANYLSLVNRV